MQKKIRILKVTDEKSRIRSKWYGSADPDPQQCFQTDLILYDDTLKNWPEVWLDDTDDKFTTSWGWHTGAQDYN